MPPLGEVVLGNFALGDDLLEGPGRPLEVRSGFLEDEPLVERDLRLL